MKWWHWLLIGTGVYVLFFRKTAAAPLTAEQALSPKAPLATTEPLAQATSQTVYQLSEKLANALRKAGAIGLTDTISTTKAGGNIEFRLVQNGVEVKQPMVTASSVEDFNAQMTKTFGAQSIA